VIQAIEQALALCQKGQGKKCILIEGESGIGKSTIFAIILEKNKYPYVKISVGSQNVYALLKDAFHAGKAVILDEFNLDEKLEILLNQLLSGVDEEGISAKNPGFIVLSSQNPSSNNDQREPISPALHNRIQFLYVEPCTAEEHKMLAERYCAFYPDAFFVAFETAREKYPHANSRTFFNLVKKKPDDELLKKWNENKCYHFLKKEMILNDSYWKSIINVNKIPDGIVAMRQVSFLAREEFFAAVRQIALDRLSQWTCSRPEKVRKFYEAFRNSKTIIELFDRLFPLKNKHNQVVSFKKAN